MFAKLLQAQASAPGVNGKRAELGSRKSRHSEVSIFFLISFYVFIHVLFLSPCGGGGEGGVGEFLFGAGEYQLFSGPTPERHYMRDFNDV